MADWFAASWLIAAETSEGIVALLVAPFVAPPEELPVVAAIAVWVIVVLSSLTLSSPSPNTLYMLLLRFCMYPCCPAMLCSWIDGRRLVYALCTKVLRLGYVLIGNASHILNSFNGNIPDAIRSLTALLMICLGVYGPHQLFEFSGTVLCSRIAFLGLCLEEMGFGTAGCFGELSSCQACHMNLLVVRGSI